VIGLAHCPEVFYNEKAYNLYEEFIMSFLEVLSLFRGVAMFLFGMTLMGNGLKKVSGNKLEPILFRLSGTPLRAILLGTGVTAVIQSSSATSVMTVGFVNSGMMKVRQAIYVILGAILGTSITGWVICLSYLEGGGSLSSILSTNTLVSIVAITGILFRMIGKDSTRQHIGDILMGFAVLMVGMHTMSDSVSGLREMPWFMSAMSSMRHPLLGIIVGA
jgi:phosphate:Na+ symporter